MRRLSIQLSVGVIALFYGLGMSGSLLPEAQAQYICGQTLGPGGTFVLTADLGPCTTKSALLINGSSLDLQGHTVSCANLTGIGIEMIGQGGRVKNGIVTGCDKGVVAGSKGKHLVQNINSHHNASYGFRVTSPGNTLDDNTAQLNGADGFQLTLDTNRLDNNIASLNGGNGFDLDAGKGLNQLFGNLANFNGSRGFDINTPKNRLSGNIAIENSQDGFRIDGTLAVSNVLSQNIAQENTKKGIYVNANTNQLIGNIITGNGKDGITIEALVSGNLVRSNDVEKNTNSGIAINSGATKNSLDHNTSLDNGALDPGVFDMQDDNVACGSDKWTSNIFNTRSQACIH